MSREDTVGYARPGGHSLSYMCGRRCRYKPLLVFFGWIWVTGQANPWSEFRVPGYWAVADGGSLIGPPYLFVSYFITVDGCGRQPGRKNSLHPKQYHGLWCCCCHFFLENALCIMVVSEAKSALECEARWFLGWKIRRPGEKDPSPDWASISSYI